MEMLTMIEKLIGFESISEQTITLVQVQRCTLLD
jgi:hypothetical protein